MEKLTAKEIIDRLQKYMDVAAFAFGDLEYGDYKFSDDLIRQFDAWYATVERCKNHPAYIDDSVQDEKYAALNDELDRFNNMKLFSKQEEEFLNGIGIGPIIEVEQQGGLDQGRNWYSIKYFPNHDVYLKVTGDYFSHHGTDFYDDWDCCTEVKPTKKTITVYEPV